MAELIPNLMPPVEAQTAIASVIAINDHIKPFFRNLTRKEKLGLRTMSTGREGIVRRVSQIAAAHPNALSRDDDPADLAAKLDYYNQLEAMRQLIMKSLEQVTEIQKGVGHDSMKLYDVYCNALQIARERDSALDLEMEEVDEYNKRFGVRDPEDLPEGEEGGEANDDTPDTPIPTPTPTP